MDEEGSERGFRVKDRRRFDPSGAAKSVPEPAKNSGPSSVADAQDWPLGATVSGQPDEESEGGQIGFSEFILSLATNAMMQLGLSPDDPGRIQGRPQLAAASQHIDILAMLQQKTRGNLAEDERSLLEALLRDLRLQFVAVSRAVGR
jgi:hypothetical protein